MQYTAVHYQEKVDMYIKKVQSDALGSGFWLPGSWMDKWNSRIQEYWILGC